MEIARRLPVGAEVLPNGSVHVRIWAPKRSRVAVVLTDRRDQPSAVELSRDADGYFAGLVPDAEAGSHYFIRLDDDDRLYPDPASRFQPEGPFGPSQVIDPKIFDWTDDGWTGPEPENQILYEMHIGTFTPEGDWTSAAEQFGELAALGITTLEVMPINDFSGRFGWGYDGVNLFAPTRLYGAPDDVRRFVDRAHACGLAVILDVVYNHLGPDGNFLKPFSDSYFTDRYENEWGEAINFDGPDADGSRDFFLANAGYWIDEFHFDGLRLDATQQIFDRSDRPILAEISRRVREAGRTRGCHTLLIGENEPQNVRSVKPADQGGYGFDALWNDDFHHSAIVALTGLREAYFIDHAGTPQEFVSAAKYGFLFQGQRYSWQGKPRGTPTFGLPYHSFVNFIQNHDQIANSGRGERLHQRTDAGRYRALTALMLLMPGMPMLFQGQEFAASAPFLYFADHKPELAELVRKGRAEFLSQFRDLATPEMQRQLPDPADPVTFRRCKLDFSEREKNHGIYALHADLLRLRRQDVAFTRIRPGMIDGAVLGPECFLLRWLRCGIEDRLLVVNFGCEFRLDTMAEPLLAPPEAMIWVPRWSSEDPRYGGYGTVPLGGHDIWTVPGHAAVVLAPEAENVR
jgi:maltooligosyltrehalose trehalohydrolase